MRRIYKPAVTYQKVIDAIDSGAFTVPELRLITKKIKQKERNDYRMGMILTAASVTVGCRVRLNEKYRYKTLQGLTGTVVEVHPYNIDGVVKWIHTKVKLDFVPTGRKPKYAPDRDNCVTVWGDGVDLIPSIT